MKSLIFLFSCFCICLFPTSVEVETYESTNEAILKVFNDTVPILKMTSVVIYTECGEILSRGISTTLDEYFVKRVKVNDLHSLKTSTRSKIREISDYSSVEEMAKNLNFIIVCNSSCVTLFLGSVANMDLYFGDTTTLKHYSRWIIVLPNKANTTEFEQFLFDNAIVVSVHKMAAVVDTLIVSSRSKYLQRLSVLNDKTLFPNMEYGMKETQLTVVAMEWGAHTQERILEDGSLDIKGVSRDVLNGLASTFNFTYIFVMPEDKLWGSQDKVGTWNGVVGILQRHEADMCITPYAWSPEKSKVMEYGYFISYDEWIIIYKEKTSTQMNKWDFLTRCFKYEVYLCWMLAWVLTLGLFCLFELNDVQVRRKKRCWTALEIVTYAISAPLQQASNSLPSSRSGRVLLCFWWLLSIVMTSVYTGNLMASLAVTVNEVPFSNLRELAENDDYAAAAIGGTEVEGTLKTSKLKVYQDIWKKIQRSRQSESSNVSKYGLEHHLKLLSHGEYALIVSGVIAEDIMSNICDVKIMKEIVYPVQSGFVFPQGYPLSAIFSERMKIMMETGLIEHWEKKWTPKKKICDVPTNVKVQSIDLDVMFSTVIVALAGIGAALAVLSVELLYAYLKK